MKQSLVTTVLALMLGAGYLAAACAPATPTRASSDLTSGDDDDDDDDSAKKKPKKKSTSNVDSDDFEDGPGTVPPPGNVTPNPLPGDGLPQDGFQDGFPQEPGGGDAQFEQCFGQCLGANPQLKQIDSQLMQCEQQCGQSGSEQCFMQCEQQVCGQAPQACDQIFGCLERCDPQGGSQGGFDQGGFF